MVPRVRSGHSGLHQDRRSEILFSNCLLLPLNPRYLCSYLSGVSKAIPNEEESTFNENNHQGGSKTTKVGKVNSLLYRTTLYDGL
jgi:hypothetical protein